MHLTIINGPNLNLLGIREPEIYGTQDFLKYLDSLRNKFSSIKFSYHQSNVEGVLVDKLQQASLDSDGIILNAGAYSHTSLALADAISAIKTSVIEVHISNIHSREAFRKDSLIASHSIGSVSGFGLGSYELAVYYFFKLAGK